MDIADDQLCVPLNRGGDEEDRGGRGQEDEDGEGQRRTRTGGRGQRRTRRDEKKQKAVHTEMGDGQLSELISKLSREMFFSRIHPSMSTT